MCEKCNNVYIPITHAVQRMTMHHKQTPPPYNNNITYQEVAGSREGGEGGRVGDGGGGGEGGDGGGGGEGGDSEDGGEGGDSGEGGDGGDRGGGCRVLLLGGWVLADQSPPPTAGHEGRCCCLPGL